MGLQAAASRRGGRGQDAALARPVRGEPFEENAPKTPGIDIRPVELEHPAADGVTMQLNAWDFGGQEIYHATHQFFLSERSLFLLVWNARHGYEQGKLYYWLDTIQAKAPDSPVLIVAAHADQHPASLPLQDTQRKYPQVLGHYEVSNRDGTGIPELRERLREVAADLPLLGEEWPAAWFDAANAVRAIEERVRHAGAPARDDGPERRHGQKRPHTGAMAPRPGRRPHTSRTTRSSTTRLSSTPSG